MISQTDRRSTGSQDQEPTETGFPLPTREREPKEIVEKGASIYQYCVIEYQQMAMRLEIEIRKSEIKIVSRNDE